MRYNIIEKCECCNGLGWGITLFVQGCHFHCKGCFNTISWDFNGGKKFTQDTQDTILKLIQPDYIKHFTIQGGEPLEECNWTDLYCLLSAVKEKYRPDIQVWLYTGYTYEYLQEQRRKKGNEFLGMILNQVDVLVDGPFQENKKDLTYPFAGSTNQRIIDMRKTRESNKVILLDI